MFWSAGRRSRAQPPPRFGGRPRRAGHFTHPSAAQRHSSLCLSRIYAGRPTGASETQRRKRLSKSVLQHAPLSKRTRAKAKSRSRSALPPCLSRDPKVGNRCVSSDGRETACVFPARRPSAGALQCCSPAAAADKRTFEIVRLVQKDKPKVLQFLRKFFYHDEPLNTAVGLRPDMICPTLEEYSLSTFDEGISVGAVAGDGSLVGVCINATLTREEDEENRRKWEEVADDVLEDAKALEDADAKFAQIKRLLSHAMAQGDVFGQGPPGLDRLFDICVLSVDSSWRGKGIASKLLDRSREIAQAEGHRLMRIVCSSYVSALIASRMGYRCIAKLDYKTVLDRKGQRIFPTEPPHDSITTYVLDI